MVARRLSHSAPHEGSGGDRAVVWREVGVTALSCRAGIAETFAYAAHHFVVMAPEGKGDPETGSQGTCQATRRKGSLKLRWYQFHLSTYVICMLALGLIVGMQIESRRYIYDGQGVLKYFFPESYPQGGSAESSHGWPNRMVIIQGKDIYIEWTGVFVNIVETIIALLLIGMIAESAMRGKDSLTKV